MCKRRLKSGMGLLVIIALFWPMLIPVPAQAASTLVPKFSHPGGFYAREFPLVLTLPVPRGEIRYTLDGSEPTADSLPYTEPIPVVFYPDHDGDIAYVETTMERIPNIMKWLEPAEEPYKATVVRARYFSNTGEAGPVETHTYFAAADIHRRFTMPVISIATDPQGLFSDDTGIYVPGKIYREENSDLLLYGQQPANYNQRGDEWERTAHMAWYDPDGTLGFENDVGIRIHGGWSRIQTMKSLRIYARTEYGEGSIVFPFFTEGMMQTYERLLLRNGGQDFYFAFVRDALAHSITADLNLDVQQVRPVVVLMNGVYWGIHYVRERYDERYFQKYHGIEPEQLILLENNGVLMVGEEGDPNLWFQLLDYLRENSLADEENYQYVLRQIDLESFLDQVLLGIYSANQDWPGNNVRFWRVRDPVQTDTVLEKSDGRWRWLINDLDRGFMIPEFNMYDLLMEETNSYPAPAWSTVLFRSLMAQTDFRSRFLERLDYHLNSTFSAEHVLFWTDIWQDQLRPEMAQHIARWRKPESIGTWEENVDVIRSFAQDRPAFLRRQTEEVFGLEGSHRLTVMFPENGGGDVLINGIPVSSDQRQWEGDFFAGTSLHLEGIPRTWYQFQGWVTADGEEVDVSDLSLQKDMVIQPLFVRKFWAQLPALLLAGSGLLIGLVVWVSGLIRRKKQSAYDQLLSSRED